MGNMYDRHFNRFKNKCIVLSTLHIKSYLTVIDVCLPYIFTSYTTFTLIVDMLLGITREKSKYKCSRLNTTYQVVLEQCSHNHDCEHNVIQESIHVSEFSMLWVNYFKREIFQISQSRIGLSKPTSSSQFTLVTSKWKMTMWSWPVLDAQWRAKNALYNTYRILIVLAHATIMSYIKRMLINVEIMLPNANVQSYFAVMSHCFDSQLMYQTWYSYWTPNHFDGINY